MQYLNKEFSLLNDAKNKEGLFTTLQILKLFKYEIFKRQTTSDTALKPIFCIFQMRRHMGVLIFSNNLSSQNFRLLLLYLHYFGTLELLGI